MSVSSFNWLLSDFLFLVLFQTTAQSLSGIGYGIRREIFFLNLEDGYFGCQVNESTDVLQLYELSKLCDGVPNCFLGSDELRNELKCTSKCILFYSPNFKLFSYSNSPSIIVET